MGACTIRTASNLPPGPNFVLNTTSLSFGSVPIGLSSTQTVTVTNTGTMNSLSITGVTTITGYTVTPNPPASYPIIVAPGASKNFDVTFAPTSEGTIAGNIIFAHNAAGGTTNLAVSGVGLSANPHFVLNTSSLDFSNVAIGSSSTLSITVTNTGILNALSITGVTSIADYAVSPNPPASYPITVAAGASYNFKITFSPTSKGIVAGNIVFAHNAEGGTTNLAVSGNGLLPPIITVLPDSLVVTLASGDSTTQTMTLGNAGGSVLNWSIANSGSFWSTTPSSGSISAGSSQPVNIKINARYFVGGDYRELIAISSNDIPNNPKNIPVNMYVTGKPTIYVKPDTLDEGMVYIGIEKVDTIIVENIGSEVLNVTNITSSLPTFVPSPTSFSLSRGDKQSVIVRFTPTDSIVYNGILTITSNDSYHPTVDIVLQGEGIPTPIISISPSSLSVEVASGEETTGTITISNDGRSNLHFTASIGFEGASSLNKSSASNVFASTYKGTIQDGVEFRPDHIIVKFKDKILPSRVSSMRSLLKAQVAKKFKKMRAEVWKLTGVSVADAIAQLKNDPNIEYAEPDYIVHTYDRTPNDALFSQLWGMQKIKAPAAWDMTTGTDIIIGDIDTGIDPNHEDLSVNLWTNPGEIAGNGIDDDGNGYIDDIHGWDFYNNDNDPFDDHSHGTHTAGTIAATGNNSTGVAGVCWSAKIMALKFLGSFGGGSTSDAILALEYATMMGAKLTSNSWGGGGYSQALYDAIQAAKDAGVLFIAAAGNDSRNTDITPNYPSCYNLDNIICVASTTSDDGLSYFSNYGLTSVDLGAPGSGVLSTIPGNSYVSKSGTSMSTPHVSGVAGLILSLNPLLNWSEVKSIILSSVDTIPSLAGKTATGGRLNAERVLQKVQTCISINPQSGIVPPGTSLNLTVSFDAQGVMAGDYQSTVIINSDDPANNPKLIPITMHVTGNPTITATPDTVKVGTIFIGDTSNNIVKIKNIGTATLNVTNITSSLPVFTINTTNFILTPPGEKWITVRFIPTASMVYNGVLTITSNDPTHSTFEVILQGQGLNPPIISVTPDSLSFTVNQGNSAQGQLLISNSGLSPLTYEIGLDISSQMQSGSLSKNKATTFKWKGDEKFPINANNSKQIKPLYAASSLLPVIITDPVGDAPLFDITEIRGEVSGGMLTLQIVTATSLDPFVLEFISGAIGLDIDQNAATGIDLYPFLIPAQEVGCEFLLIPDGITTRGIRLMDSTSTIVKSYVPIIDLDGGTITVSVPLADLRNDNGEMNIAAGIGEFLSLQYDDAPDVGHGYIGPNWITVNPLQGTVAPGGSQIISVNVNANNISISLYQATLKINNNDPLNRTKNIPVNMYVLEGFFNYTINQGWNIVSVPLAQTNYTATALFPNLYGSMHEFVSGSGYSPVSVLQLGKGYWLNYHNSATVPITGTAPGSIIFNGKVGWNIIGSRQVSTDVLSLMLSGGATISGNTFYIFVPGTGYLPRSTIEPGQGAWIYISADCTITIP